MLKERQKSILDASIKEYIKTAKPVASKGLVRKYNLKLSPATIRHELCELSELGYLEQPHTSAGRIPTDRGYRFFVDGLDEDLHLTVLEEKLISAVFDIKDEEGFLRELGRIVSKISGTFTATGFFEDETVYETGFSEILEEPEFRESGCAIEFGRLVDILDSSLRGLLNEVKGDGEKIFIGKENPLLEARSYSMLISSWSHPIGFDGFIAMVGPKRTNYAKHKALINRVKHNKS